MAKTIYISGGNSNTQKRVELPEEATTAAIKQAAIDEGIINDGAASDICIVLEDHDEPIAPNTAIKDIQTNRPLRFYCGTCRHVELTVYYQGREETWKASPSHRIKKVIKDAVKKFGIPQGDASDLVLRASPDASSPELEKDLLLGSLLKPGNCSLSLYLGPLAIVNG